MSFRISRSRNIEPSLNRRRSLSQSRLDSSTPTSSWSSRPISSNYYGNTVANLRNQYQSKYGSKESLYSPTSRKSFFSGSNGYGSSSYNNGSDSRYGSNSSLYSSNPYSSDRYVSPYSNYDNGVTTAGLSLSLGASGLNSYGSNGGRKRDYTPSRNSNLLSSSNISGSNTSLNSYGNGIGSSSVSRSQSFRDSDRDRKSRSRTKSRQSASVRSMSASSEKSEGYESGSEQPSTRTSRLQSSSSVDQTESKKAATDAGDVEENGELIDYKALYEASRIEIDNLKTQLQKKEDVLQSTKAALERFTNATTKNSLSELEKRERRALERKLSEMEEELKLLQKFKTENERLRAENRALTRVVSKLTTSAQSQLQQK
ncbi:hypothetical protein DMENIID0001_050220 [Sergentomyia squamirostris]